MNRIYEKSSTFRLLKGRRGFSEGISNSLGGGNILNKYNFSKSNKCVDSEAINSDWRMVGEAIEESIERYGKKK